MKLALTILTIASLAGCGQPSAPSVPPPAPTHPAPSSSALTWLWAMVVDETGLCIPGATIQVVGGQALGQPVIQRTPCDAWAYDGGVVLRDLMPGVEMTLKASAAGYAPHEKSVAPHLGGQMAVLLTPDRID